MAVPSRYLLVSLPTHITLSNDRDEALNALRNAVSTDYGTTTPFSIPTFKIGTLDTLVRQADEISKLCADCEIVVGKVGDSLSGILEGDQAKVAQQKNVNDSMSTSSRPGLWIFAYAYAWGQVSLTDPGWVEPVDQYLQTYSWNKVKYRMDKPIAELIDTLRKVRRCPRPHAEARA